VQGYPQACSRATARSVQNVAGQEPRGGAHEAGQEAHPRDLVDLPQALVALLLPECMVENVEVVRELKRSRLSFFTLDFLATSISWLVIFRSSI